jgi:hypothetical protein
MVYFKDSFLLTLQQAHFILEQMKKCICTVYMGKENGFGTGFFCNIPYKNQKLKVLITASSHIKNHLKRSKITIKLNDAIKEIKINDDRKIYLNENYNTAIIEINPSKDGINDFLELDEFFNERINERVYTIQLDREQNTCISFGTLIKIEENEIYHLCSTEMGSSGSPILNINTCKVIGIHLHYYKDEQLNMGTLLNYIIKDFNQDNNLVNLYNDKSFSNLKLISSGSYGDIYSAYSIKDKIEVCLKKINIEKMKLNYELNNLENYQKDLDNEINILNILSDNKNSVNILGSYDNENEKIIVMEKCDQNLYEFIKKRGKALTVEEIKLKFEGINELFESIQRNYIIHRDLKLENFLIKYNKEKTDYVIKLGDYGIGKFKYRTNGIYSGLKGTIDTIAPEIILEKTKEYKSSVDMFSLGIILYQLSHNLKHPYGKNLVELVSKYTDNYDKDNLEIDFDKSIKNNDFKDLVKKMIKLNPKNRLSWAITLNINFLRSN